MNIELSSAFRKFSPRFTKRKYNKITIRSKKDLLTPDFQKYVERRKELFSLFNSDRLRFFRAEGASTNDVVEELSILLNKYSIPLFAYEFKRRESEITLNSFFK
jgi:hypothetical protein